MPQRSTQLVALFEQARQSIQNFYDALPAAERGRVGTWETWAPKDFLAHITYWQNSSLAILDELHQPPPDLPDFQDRNHQNFLATHNQAWDEIHAAYHASLDAIRARLDKLSDADLTEPNRFPRLRDGATLESNLLGNCYTHPIAHLAELVAKYDNPEAALRLQEETAQTLLAFDATPYNRGTALYNLACAYALSKNVTRTVELLREAFPLRSDLVEFSKQDTDFDRVRATPEFQSLYE